jgi:hypothetical protein
LHGWLSLGGLLLAGALAADPQVGLEADTTRLSLGDPLHLRLSLRYDSGERPLPLELDAWQGFSVEELEPAARPPGSQPEQTLDTRVFRLRLFDPDIDVVPPLKVGFVDAGGDTLYRQTPPVDLEILRVRPDGDAELRDIKPPLEVPGGIPLWVVVLLVALLLVGGIVALWFWRRGRNQAAAPEKIAPPVDFAAEFERIAGLGLVEKGLYKEYYTLLSDTLRRFMEVHLGVDALERTSEEVDLLLGRAGIEPEKRRQVTTFLGAADLVKFARFAPTEEEARQAALQGRDLVRILKKEDEAPEAPVDR